MFSFKIAKQKKTWFQKDPYIILDGIIMILVYIFLFSGLKMEWLLRDIIPIGGDIPYHFANYIDLKEILLPNFQISGWSDASFGGFQLFQSYPIFPFLLIYFLDFFMGSGVAFKIVLILGAVSLPIGIYWTLFVSKIARPGPISGAILSLAYLFHDSHYAFGGNLLSVFSGEFTYSLSIFILVVFCGFLYKAFENKKYIPHAIILLALIGFTHPISFAVAIFLPLGFLIIESREEDTDKQWGSIGFFQRSSVALRIMIIGGLLFCTWAIGYYINSGLNVGGLNSVKNIISSGYGWGLKFNYLIPELLSPFGVVFLCSTIYYCFQGKKLSQMQVFFLWGTLISMSFFLVKFMGFSVRFLPILYLFGILFLATTMGEIYRKYHGKIMRIGFVCLVITSALFIYSFVDSRGIFQRFRGTSGHNFIGAESRGEWESIKGAAKFISHNPDTQSDNTSISTPPRIFTYFKGDLFRVLSNASMYDSLFSNSPFSSQGIWTGRRIDKERISVKQFWDYMKLSNTKIVVGPKKLNTYVENYPEYFKFLATFDNYQVFEANGVSGNYVELIRTNVYSIDHLARWKKKASYWYPKYSENSPFIVYDPDRNSGHFKPSTDKNFSGIRFRDDCQIREMISRETIKIYTNCISRPLLIKFAYHKNWHVTGADKIYLTTPAFMLIVPEQNEVTLSYGKRPYNYIAYACGFFGILLFFTYGYISAFLQKNMSLWTKEHKKPNKLLQRVRRKYQLDKKRGIFLSQNATMLCIIILLMLIAVIYAR